jgi:four helix bundle protein
MARRHEDLIAWQLADRLKTLVYDLTDSPRIRSDFKFRDQIRDAAGSGTRNVAEGFGRYRHKEFANLVSIARASVHEVKDLLSDGVKRRHWQATDVSEAVNLCYRASKAMVGLIRYLRRTPDPPLD